MRWSNLVCERALTPARVCASFAIVSLVRLSMHCGGGSPSPTPRWRRNDLPCAPGRPDRGVRDGGDASAGRGARLRPLLSRAPPYPVAAESAPRLPGTVAEGRDSPTGAGGGARIGESDDLLVLSLGMGQAGS